MIEIKVYYDDINSSNPAYIEKYVDGELVKTVTGKACAGYLLTDPLEENTEYTTVLINERK